MLQRCRRYLPLKVEIVNIGKVTGWQVSSFKLKNLKPGTCRPVTPKLANLQHFSQLIDFLGHAMIQLLT